MSILDKIQQKLDESEETMDVSTFIDKWFRMNKAVRDLDLLNNMRQNHDANYNGIAYRVTQKVKETGKPYTTPPTSWCKSKGAIETYLGMRGPDTQPYWNGIVIQADLTNGVDIEDIAQQAMLQSQKNDSTYQQGEAIKAIEEIVNLNDPQNVKVIGVVKGGQLEWL